jgi:peptide/nickel transport system substrate-binding protein
MSRLRLAFTLLGVCSLAIGLIGPASAGFRAQTKYGGTLAFGLAEPDSIDPTLSTAGSALTVYRTMCLRLYEYDSKLQNAPVLAAALPVLSKDKLAYTIQLRQGVTFNDGTPLNAQAIVTDYQHYTSYPGSTRASDYASVDSVTATGPYTVLFHLKTRDSTFTGNMYVLSPTALANEGDSFGQNPVCAGPFMFDHRIVGDNITVIKSPYWYDRKDVFLDKIVFKVVTDPVAAAAALRAGDLQVLGAVSPTELEAVQQDSDLRVLQSPQIGWSGLRINIGNRNGVGNLPYTNVGTPLASSPKLRQAFEEAIDRNAMNRVLFGGLYRPSCTIIPAANTLWYDAMKVPCTPYDPRDARRLVAASGVASPTVHILTGTGNNTLAQFIQAQEAAVGINVVIDTADGAALTALRDSGHFDVTGAAMVPGQPDPNTEIYQQIVTSGARNYGGYSNPRLDYVLANGLKATEPKARAVDYHVAQQIIHDDRPLIVLYNGVTIVGVSRNVTGVQLTPVGAVTVVNARFT